MGSDIILSRKTWKSELHKNWRSETVSKGGPGKADWLPQAWDYKDRNPCTIVTSIISSSADFFFFSLDWPELWADSFLLTAPSAIFSALGPRMLLEEQDGIFTADLKLSSLPRCSWRTGCTKRPADLFDFSCANHLPDLTCYPFLGVCFAARTDLLEV